MAENRPNPMKLLMQMQMEVAAGKIKAINPIHLIMNIISLCAFPFVGKPMFKGIFHISDKEYLQVMEMRKQEVIDFVINALKV